MSRKAKRRRALKRKKTTLKKTSGATVRESASDGIMELDEKKHSPSVAHEFPRTLTATESAAKHYWSEHHPLFPKKQHDFAGFTLAHNLQKNPAFDEKDTGGFFHTANTSEIEPQLTDKAIFLVSDNLKEIEQEIKMNCDKASSSEDILSHHKKNITFIQSALSFYCSNEMMAKMKHNDAAYSNIFKLLSWSMEQRLLLLESHLESTDFENALEVIWGYYEFRESYDHTHILSADESTVFSSDTENLRTRIGQNHCAFSDKIIIILHMLTSQLENKKEHLTAVRAVAAARFFRISYDYIEEKHIKDVKPLLISALILAIDKNASALQYYLHNRQWEMLAASAKISITYGMHDVLINVNDKNAKLRLFDAYVAFGGACVRQGYFSKARENYGYLLERFPDALGHKKIIEAWSQMPGSFPQLPRTFACCCKMIDLHYNVVRILKGRWGALLQNILQDKKCENETIRCAEVLHRVLQLIPKHKLSNSSRVLFNALRIFLKKQLSELLPPGKDKFRVTMIDEKSTLSMKAIRAYILDASHLADMAEIFKKMQVEMSTTFLAKMAYESRLLLLVPFEKHLIADDKQHPLERAVQDYRGLVLAICSYETNIGKPQQALSRVLDLSQRWVGNLKILSAKSLLVQLKLLKLQVPIRAEVDRLCFDFINNFQAGESGKKKFTPILKQLKYCVSLLGCERADAQRRLQSRIVDAIYADKYDEKGVTTKSLGIIRNKVSCQQYSEGVYRALLEQLRRSYPELKKKPKADVNMHTKVVSPVPMSQLGAAVTGISSNMTSVLFRPIPQTKRKISTGRVPVPIRAARWLNLDSNESEIQILSLPLLGLPFKRNALRRALLEKLNSAVVLEDAYKLVINDSPSS